MTPERIRFRAGPEDADKRLDLAILARCPELPRAEVQRWIRAGLASVGGETARASRRLCAGDEVEASPPAPPPPRARAPLDLRILAEEDAFIAIDKPPRLVTHAMPGSSRDSVVARLLAAGVPLAGGADAARPGVVHRLDRDTSGVLILSKTPAAHARLADAFARRLVRKEYRAIVEGVPAFESDRVTKSIRRLRGRMRMAAGTGGREAETVFEVVERFRGFALVCAKPRTGRTHQIRVHLASAGLPVLCDPVYGRRRVLRGSDLAGSGLPPERILLDRQALHAARLEIPHPETGLPLVLESPIPADIQALLSILGKILPAGGV